MPLVRPVLEPPLRRRPVASLPRLSPVRRIGWLAACCLGPALVACGHPATERECEEIVERIAYLELSKLYSGAPEELKSRTEETKRELRSSMLKECVGKRITDQAMTCVRNAKTSDVILDDCLPFSAR